MMTYKTWKLTAATALAVMMAGSVAAVDVGAGVGGNVSTGLGTTAAGAGVGINARGSADTTTGANGATTGASMNADTHTNVTAGADLNGLKTMLPSGTATYTYYPAANVYYAPHAKTYYSVRDGRWTSSSDAPAGVKLGASQKVKLRGKMEAR